MSKSNKVAQSALIIAIFTLGSKFLGVIRETLIAAKFGSGMESDTFFIALSAISLITNLISSAITTTFIPILSRIEIKEGKKKKIIHTNNMMNIMIVISMILTILGLICAPLIVRVVAMGFYGEQFNLAVKLTRIGLPMILFSGISGSITAFLQSEYLHMSTAAIGFPFNFVYIFYLLIFASQFGITGLTVAAVLATASQLLIQIPEARKAGYRYKRIFDLKDEYIKKVLYLSGPVLLGVAINDIGVIIDKTLASGLVAGSISALNYGDRLNSLVRGVFVTAITTVIFPIISKESNRDNMDGMKKIMGDGVNLILLITIPATVGLIILAEPVIQVVFQRGEFNFNDTIMTAEALVFYSVGLVSSSLRLLITRVYYSLQDTKTPMMNGIFGVGLDIVLNIILVKYMAHGGLALSTSISSIVATLILFYGLKKKIGSLGTASYIKCGLKSGIASVIMGLFVYIIYNGLYGILGMSKLYNLISLLVAVGIGVVIYGVLCYVFRVKEVRNLVNGIIKK